MSDESPPKPFAVVTGASSGIGREFARLLAADGYDLMIVARSTDKLKELKASLEKKHQVNVMVLSKDLSVLENVPVVAEKLQKRKVDVLINNAGFGDFGRFTETDWKKEEAMMNLNMQALTLLSKRFAKKMTHQQSGKILNVASTAAFQPGPFMAVYFATKAYVLSFTQALANELKDVGVSVTALCPPATATGFQSEAHMEESGLVENRSSLMSAEKVAEYGYRSLMKGRVIAVPGFKNRLLIFLQRFLPRGFVVQMIRSMLEKRDS